MREQKKYTSVIRYGHKSTIGLLEYGDSIVIQEKIDGANASFMLDNGKIRAFSRKLELDETNTLGGFYEWTQTLDKKLLVEGALYFGEWTNRHKIHYPEYEKQFFLFDIYNTSLGMYMGWWHVELESSTHRLNLVPVLYAGEYKSFVHLLSFVGQTKLGGRLGDIETGEGIVVKKTDDNNNVFVKLVIEHFREVKKEKAPRDPQKTTQEQLFVDETVTTARVEKMLFNLVDENILDENFGLEDMGTILKNLNQRVMEDILKEESDSLPEDYNSKWLSKAVARKVAPTVKQIIATRGGA
jgi:hypothetical protein